MNLSRHSSGNRNIFGDKKSRTPLESDDEYAGHNREAGSLDDFGNQAFAGDKISVLLDVEKQKQEYEIVC